MGKYVEDNIDSEEGGKEEKENVKWTANIHPHSNNIGCCLVFCAIDFVLWKISNSPK